jgi:DNA polymerase III delta prime subunit
MAFYYYYNLTQDIKKAKEQKDKTYSSLQPFYQYLDNTRKAFENRTVTAGWEKVGGNRIRLVPTSLFYRITPITQIKLIESKNWFLVKDDKSIEKDFSSPLKIRETKSSIEISPQKIKEEKKQVLIELPNEYSSYENLTVNWGFESFQLEKVGSTTSEIKEVKQKGNSYHYKIQNSILFVYGILDENELLEIDGKKIRYEVEDRFDRKNLNGKNIINDKESWILISEKESSLNWKNAKIEKIEFDFHWLDNFSEFETNGRPVSLDCTSEERLLFLINTESNFDTVYSKNPRIQFRVNNQNTEEFDRYWIQLTEDENEENDYEINSPLEYFFDDEVEIEEIINNRQSGNRFKIFKGNATERRIVLINQNRKFVFPTNGSKLRAKRNIYQISKQIQAIRNLQERPSIFHQNLLNLFEDKNKVDWKASYYEYDEVEWKILTDDSYSGVEKQREFVKKALNTPEFAIMEGPPGSGKTTVILELIYQLLKQGKRVLLCGSTHVAIDNILERIQEKELLDTILPIRIGDKNRISEQIKHFSLEEIREKYADIGEKLLLESANLVCGTTIGILQHPRIKEIKPNDSIVPEFDYLIIDESSKTTFQEFLVPALYAKKWIIVGDVKQLSPFTEPLQITTNLENMELNNKKELSLNLQKICLLLFKLHPFQNCKFIIPLSISEITELNAELSKRQDILQNFKIAIISNHFTTKEQSQILILNENKFKEFAIYFYDFNLIFIEKELVNKLIRYLPETMGFLLDENWKTSIHAFKHNKYRNSISFKVDRETLNDSFQINEEMIAFFREKSWATEVGWRLNRTYEKRFVKGRQEKKDPLQEQIEKLLPKSIDIQQNIETIRYIAFPSVLEGMVKGIKDRYVKNLTTLTSGFQRKDLTSRHVILDYQHRMHPDISSFPRERFYSEKDDSNNTSRALLDGKGMEEKRAWGYTKYKNRKIWIHVQGKVIGNSNSKEAERLIQELEQFVDWAKNQPLPNNQTSWEIAVLTFYRKQEKELRNRLRTYCNLPKKESRFQKDNCLIKLHTVDKFQGQEADIVFLSMVQNQRDGFMDSPNRLNVAITRARYQFVILGDYEYFSQKTRSEDLKELAKNTIRIN